MGLGADLDCRRAHRVVDGVLLAQSLARYFEARKASGVVAGFPDLVCAIPGGRTVFFETKRPVGGVVSEQQQAVHERLRNAGHVVGVVTSPETALAVLQAAGIPLRATAGMIPAFEQVRRAPKRRLPADALPI